MNFLFPTFLVALSAIAIPIIIHLFHFRKYKKVYFTNVQLLKELQQESESKSKLREYLVLAMRILTIASLVFAFAQPFIPVKNKHPKGEKAISIYVDNSFSMENTNKQGTLLENAKQYATEIVMSFKASDQFQLLTNDFEGKHQRLLSKEEFLEQLNEVKISPATKNSHEILKRQKDFLQHSKFKTKQVFLLSDFQKNAFNFLPSDMDSTIEVSCIPISSSETNNVYIDSVWFETPLQQFGTLQLIHASIVNKSNKDIDNGTLKLIINDQQVSLSSFNIAAKNKKELSISFTVKEKGINRGLLKIEDYPITYDDDFYFSFNAQMRVNVLVVSGKECRTSGNFKSLMLNDSLFEFAENTESAINYSLFSKTHLIVLNEMSTMSSGLVSELQKFVTNGGSIVIFPSRKADLASYNNAFQNLQLPQLTVLDTTPTKVQTIHLEQGLYESVFEKIDQRMDLPKVFEHYELKPLRYHQAILSLQNNRPFLLSTTATNGKMYLFSVPSDELSSNFIKHALFVPTLLKIAILSLNPSPIYYTAAANEVIKLPFVNTFNEKPWHIISRDKTIDVIPECRFANNTTRLFTQYQIKQAGYYDVIKEPNENINTLAFNLMRKESDMSFYTKEELEKQIDEHHLQHISIIEATHRGLTKTIQDANEGKMLWKLFLILALVFLLGEGLIIRLYKN